MSKITFIRAYVDIVKKNPNISAEDCLKELAIVGHNLQKENEDLDKAKARLSQHLTFARKLAKQNVEEKEESLREKLNKETNEDNRKVIEDDLNKVVQKIRSEYWNQVIPQLKRGRAGGGGSNVKEELENFLADIG